MKVRIVITKKYICIVLAIVAGLILWRFLAFHNSARPDASTTAAPIGLDEFASRSRTSGSLKYSQADIDEVKKVAAEKGVAAAYDFLKQKWGSDAVGAHDLAHVIGRVAYDQQGIKGLAICDNNFAYGCFHGLMEELIHQKGVGSLPEALKGCEALTPQGAILSCLHGVGHGVMSLKGDITAAIKECATFADNERPYCYDGSYMEYYTGVMNTDAAAGQFTTTKPWAFCLSQPKESQGQCVRNHTIAWEYEDASIAATMGTYCSQLASGLRAFCTGTTGLYASQVAHGDPAKVMSTCDTFKKTASDYASCITSGAQEFIFQNQPVAGARTLCGVLAGQYASTCTDTVNQTMKDYGRS